MKHQFYTTMVMTLLLTPVSAFANNVVLIDEQIDELDQDKARLDQLYKPENVAATFKSCFDRYKIKILGVNYRAGDYKTYGEPNLSMPYKEYTSDFFYRNKLALQDLKRNAAIPAYKIVDGMEVYRRSIEDISRTLRDECNAWALMTKWDIDNGVNISNGESFTAEQLRIKKTWPFNPQQRVAKRNADLKRAGEKRPFSNLNLAQPLDRPRTLDELIAKLEQFSSPAGPLPPGQSSLQINAATLADFHTKLAALDVQPNDWLYLISRHFYPEGKFTPKTWKNFIKFVSKSTVSSSDRQNYAKMDAALSTQLHIPQASLNYLRSNFFRTKTLKRYDFAEGFGGRYENYVLYSLLNPTPAFASTLNDECQLTIKKLKASTDANPYIPEVKAATYEQLNPDCSWTATLIRMKALDPAFAMKWDTHVTGGMIMSSLGPGGTAGTSGSGTAFKRAILIAGVREAMKLCKAGNLY